MKQSKTILARLLISLLIISPNISVSLASGIPVVDAANVAQAAISAAQNMQQTLKQIQEYKTQLQEYENMLLNSVQPTTQIWGQIESTINDLMLAVDTLNYYKQKIGSIDAYLAKYKDLNYYRQSPCFVAGSCSEAAFKQLMEGDEIGAEAQKKANDALFKGIDVQQDKIKTDAIQLKALQVAAGNATGRLQALGYANQLAALQGQQMLQMRSMLVAQLTAINTRNQVIADREARGLAAREAMTLRLSPKVLPGGKNWSIDDAH